jgi:hypothetical protein
MSSSDDTATAAGATNVALNQRAASAPYRRTEVNIQGDENPRRAIGFSATGVLTALEIDENPFAVVDTEAQFDAALAAGRSIVLRGEGSGGIVSLTTPKNITAQHTTIKGPAVCRFTLDQNASATPRAITVHADDVTFQNFELTSTQALASNNCYGIALAELDEDHGHRMKILDMLIHNWMRCISKNGSLLTTSQEDVVIERVRAHTAKEYVCYLNFGLTRMRMRDCRFLGWLDGAAHVTTDNAMYGGGNWRDCSFESCHFGNVGRMGFEATIPTYAYVHERTRLNWCRAENCGSMGFSLGYVQSGIISQCKATNVGQTGIEIGGRAPGFPGPPPDLSHRYAQGLVDSCEVDGVHGTDRPGYGITLDGSRDSFVSGSTRVANITSNLSPGGAIGIGISASQRCSIMGCQFDNAGNCPIYVDLWYLTNDSGFHVIADNTFRNAPGNTVGVHQSIFIKNQSASIRNNTSWQGAGMLFGYNCNTSAPAKVWCDGVAVAYGEQSYGGSNIIMPVP